MSSSGKDPVISRVKEYITPGLITILGVMLWAEISELKRDVKTLLANDASSKTKIEMLEKELYYLRERVYSDNKPLTYGTTSTGEFSPARGPAKKEDDPEVPSPQDTVA